MKLFWLYSMFFLLIHFSSISQCINTNTISNLLPVCEDQFIGEQSSGVIKINLMPVISSNKYVFSTVGESVGDTFLALYDSSNNLLVSNDDDPACAGCKQSTLVYGSISGGATVSGLYIIVSRPSCMSLNFSMNLKYSSRNEYDTDPIIASPVSIIQCIGSTINFTYNLPTSIVADNLSTPWESLDTSVATIDSTGKAFFIKKGIAKIKLKVKSSCPITNNYIVNGSLTSTIDH